MEKTPGQAVPGQEAEELTELKWRYYVVPLDRNRAEKWIKVFGSHILPVTETKPQFADGPRGRELFYLLANPELLTAKDREMLLAEVCPTFGLGIDEAQEEINKCGVPLRAAGLVWFQAVEPSDAQAFKGTQFFLEPMEQEIRDSLKGEQARMEKLRAAAYKGDPVATAEFEMIAATVGQVQAELRYLEEVQHRSATAQAAKSTSEPA